jgi:hypothetical protein
VDDARLASVHVNPCADASIQVADGFYSHPYVDAVFLSLACVAT